MDERAIEDENDTLSLDGNFTKHNHNPDWEELARLSNVTFNETEWDDEEWDLPHQPDLEENHMRPFRHLNQAEPDDDVILDESE